jgi:hypothetical protein
MTKKTKVEQLKSLINNDMSGLVFFAVTPLVNNQVPKPNDLYQCKTNEGETITKTFAELSKTKATIWNESKTYSHE